MTDLAAIIERDREWGEATPNPDAVVWTHNQLAEAYLLAGMDRRALLVLLGETREALTQIAALPPLGPFRIVSDELAAAQAIARAALSALAEP